MGSTKTTLIIIALLLIVFWVWQSQKSGEMIVPNDAQVLKRLPPSIVKTMSEERTFDPNVNGNEFFVHESGGSVGQIGARDLAARVYAGM